MTIKGKVRERVTSFFNPDGFDPLAFRSTMQLAVLGLVLGEVVVFMLLRESVDLGELPSYITDVLIISISAVEFLLGPLIGWLGTQRRRSIMVMWVFIALVFMLPVFAVPKPEAEADVALCSAYSPFRFLPSGISTKAAVRLSILTFTAISCALGRVAITAHGLAYLDAYNPSANLHMHVAILLVVRVVLLHVGTSVIKGMMNSIPWLQVLMIVVKFLIIIVKLYKYPDVPPAVDQRLGSGRTYFRSLGRVLRCKIAMLMILAMSLLAAAMWGFGSQEAEFAKMKFHVIPGEGMVWEMSAPLRALFIILGVVLVGFMYTEPVMSTYKKKRAVRNAARMSIYCVILFAVMTAALDCVKGGVAGLGDTSYNQPACGLQCGCDRPWTQFSPVCVTEQMTTYYSPCHAGCATTETVGGISMYANCTCAGGARAAAGACGDGSCTAAYGLHTLLFTAATLASALAFTWQVTVMLESVDRRDKSVALGLASGTVALFAFVGAHGVFAWIRATTCAHFRGQKCLIQNSQFIPWVGYTSTGLAGAACLVCLITFLILFRQKKAEKSVAENIDLS